MDAKLLDNQDNTNKATKIQNNIVGLTSAAAEELLEKYGFNELAVVEIPLLTLFFMQFTGTMPYMLWIACILSLVVQDYIDFAIIMTMLLCNGCLGFHEELKAKASLDELTSKMEQTVAVLRDGKGEQMNIKYLVPGDVVLLLGGNVVPADVEWIEGDVLSIDTAALTGEPLPRKYPSEVHGRTIFCGCTVKAGEAYCLVKATGSNTEIGNNNKEIMEDKVKTKISVFEQKILYCVKLIIMASIMVTLVVLLVQGIGRGEFQSGTSELILTCLSIIIAAVPIALPLVVQVTMALGAGKMAREFNAVVTSLPALQDLASMTILCSDKTGTLTTANISIISDIVWVADGFTEKDVALYAALASNRNKKEDPIDRSVINHFDDMFGDLGIEACESFTQTRSVGFNPIYKRVIAEFNHPKLGNVSVAKGLCVKVLNTEDGGKDDADDQWVVENYENLYSVVSKKDEDFARMGYKTLGVSVKINDGPWKFVGILPMFDKPRHDTSHTIMSLRNAGIEVKMITGDHLNIAIETARLIDMGVNILPGSEIRDGTRSSKESIRNCDGFAQVLPRDKRECVLVLKNDYDQVVGMTGDGVNDAPALSAAQCGIAVDDATDAAKNASAIILTSPGLGAIYDAVLESRKIFLKLKSYVIYRFAATIQIVTVLSVIIFASNCAIDSLYIILLALFNDLTMLPIAYDVQQASIKPETPDVFQVLLLAALYGALETGFSLFYAYGASSMNLTDGEVDMDSCDSASQAAVWLQISIASELLIFSARSPSYIWNSIAPSSGLMFSILTGCIITSLLAGCFDYFGGLSIEEISIIWAYDICSLIVLDLAKVQFLRFFGISHVVIKEPIISDNVTDTESVGLLSGRNHSDSYRPRKPTGDDTAIDVLVNAVEGRNGDSVRRLDGASRRLSQYSHKGSMHVSKKLDSSFDSNASTSIAVKSINLKSRSMRFSDVGTSEKGEFDDLSGLSGRSTLIRRDIRPNFPPK